MSFPEAHLGPLQAGVTVPAWILAYGRSGSRHSRAVTSAARRDSGRRAVVHWAVPGALAHSRGQVHGFACGGQRALLGWCGVRPSGASHLQPSMLARRVCTAVSHKSAPGTRLSRRRTSVHSIEHGSERTARMRAHAGGQGRSERCAVQSRAALGARTWVETPPPHRKASVATRSDTGRVGGGACGHSRALCVLGHSVRDGVYVAHESSFPIARWSVAHLRTPYPRELFSYSSLVSRASQDILPTRALFL